MQVRQLADAVLHAIHPDPSVFFTNSDLQVVHLFASEQSAQPVAQGVQTGGDVVVVLKVPSGQTARHWSGEVAVAVCTLPAGIDSGLYFDNPSKQVVQVKALEHSLQLPRHLVHFAESSRYPSLHTVQVAAAVGQVRQLESVHGSHILLGVVSEANNYAGQAPSATHYSAVTDPRGAFTLVGVAGVEQVRHVV